jgi:hypothetical protein
VAGSAGIFRRYGKEMGIRRIRVASLELHTVQVVSRLAEGNRKRYGLQHGNDQDNLAKIANMIKETIMGGDTLYYVNTSLTDAFGTFSKQLFEENIKPMLSVLSENIDKIENPKVKKTCQELVNEYQKLNLLMLIQSRIIEHINTIAINVDLEDVQEAG